MNVLIADCETDGFLPTMTRIWMIQIGDADTDEVTIYADQPGFLPLRDAVNRLKHADRVVFHNGMRFDIHAINRVFPNTLRPEQVYDTLVVSRLLDPQQRKHSLKELGERLGVYKGDFEGDFSRFSQEMVEYARQDIVVGRAIYRDQQKRMQGWDWAPAVWLENLFAYVISLQEQNGFLLDVALVIELEAELRQELHDIGRELQEIFPPIVHERWSEKTGKRLKDKIEVFNPGSGQQIARRLKAKYGWKPKKFTDSGLPATDESVLASLPYDECKPLLRYAACQKMLGQIVDGDNGWLKLVDKNTSRVHGAVNTIGAATGRCSHFKPNMGQVIKKDKRMRRAWRARKGWKLVGCDAEGIEFRMLAHYLAWLDKGATIQTILKGRKEDGTDIHSLNQRAALLSLRDSAKTAIYALIYGASDTRLGLTVIDDALAAGQPRPAGSPTSLGEELRRRLGKGTPGLDKLIDEIKKAARKRGFVKGVDGRKIFIRSDHSAFNFLLQGGGAIVMKLALVIFHFERLPIKGWVHGVDFAYCANVHDEVQSEVRPEIAEEFGAELADCIREAGVRLNIRCPLAGSFDIGNDWSETH
jgi:DNA polymerase-1